MNDNDPIDWTPFMLTGIMVIAIILIFGGNAGFGIYLLVLIVAGWIGSHFNKEK